MHTRTNSTAHTYELWYTYIWRQLVKLKLVKVLAQLLHEHRIVFSLYSSFSFFKCPPSTGWWLWHCHLGAVIIPIQFSHFWGLVVGVRCPNFISPEANSMQTLLSRISTKALQFSDQGPQRISYCVHLKSAISPLNWPINDFLDSVQVSNFNPQHCTHIYL